MLKLFSCFVLFFLTCLMLLFSSIISNLSISFCLQCSILDIRCRILFFKPRLPVCLISEFNWHTFMVIVITLGLLQLYFVFFLPYFFGGIFSCEVLLGEFSSAGFKNSAIYFILLEFRIWIIPEIIKTHHVFTFFLSVSKICQYLLFPVSTSLSSPSWFLLCSF